MSTITLELEKENYENLIKLVYLGKWMVEALSDDILEVDPELEELEQIVYETGFKNGVDDIIEYDAEAEHYYPVDYFEDELMDYIDEYDEYTIFDGLAERLSERDFEAKHGSNALIMTEDEREKIAEQLLSGYYTEFEENGLENVYIKK